MKKPFKVYLLFLIALILLNSQTGFAARYRTKSNGVDWTSKRNWTESIWERRQGNNWNNHNGYPNFQNLNNDEVEIGNHSHPSHYVVLGSAEARVEMNGGNGGLEITIFRNSKLEIYGDITVENNFQIDIQDGGEFVLHGNISLKGSGGGSSQGQIIINGDAAVTGSISGNGTISGAGNLYVEGEITNGIGTGGFSGVIAEDVPNDVIPVPVIESVTVNQTNQRLVEIQWSFQDKDGNDPRNQILEIDGNAYEFAGFRIVRNLVGVNHVEKIVAGFFTEDAEGKFTGFDPNPVVKLEFEDLVEDEATDNLNLEENEEIHPRYYVRAVYVKAFDKNDSELTRDDFKLSANSSTGVSTNPLPIDLLYFTAQSIEETVVLEWATATEINNDFFTLERSMDGSQWEIVDYITGAGNSSFVRTYSYTDHSPVEGVSYYRLKQTDFDGQFEYFAPVALQFSGRKSQTQILSVQSLATGLNVWVQNKNPDALLIIANTQGQLLHRQHVPASDFSQQISLPLHGHIRGEILIIQMHSSQENDYRKIMLQ